MDKTEFSRIAAVALVCLTFVRCVNLLDLPDNPAVISGVEETCVGAKSIAPAADRAMARVHACNFVSNNCVEPVVGLTATLCNKRDVECSHPLQQNLVQDNEGDFRFEVPTGGSLGSGFDGFLRISSPRALCTDPSVFGPTVEDACTLAPACDRASPDEKCKISTFSDALLFFNPPIKLDVQAPIILPMIPTYSSFTLLSAAGTQRAGLTEGFVIVTVRDCRGAPAANATIELVPKMSFAATALYLADGVPSTSAMMTDQSGMAGLLGVPAGFQIVGARRGHADRIESGTVSVQVAPNTITYVGLVLNPSE